MTRRSLSFALAGLLCTASAVAWYGQRQTDSGGLPALPTHPTAAQEVLFARPFVLDAPYTHWYRLEQPEVSAGWILVLRVDPELARPRESLEPVLYVGDQTAERWNSAQPDGHLVVTVPAPLGADGRPSDAWADAPIWFGEAELPERVDAPRIALERARAEAAGAGALPPSVVQRAQAEGGTVLFAKSREGLSAPIADLIERFSPAEVDRVRGLRVPVQR